MHSANKQGPAPKTAATGGSGEHALAQSANPHGYGDRIYPVYKIAIIVDCLADEGTSPTDALKGTGLGVNEVHSPSTRTSLAQLLRVYGNALKLARSPAFALSTGAHIHVTYYGMYGYALLSSPTVQEALDFAVKYHELATPMVRQSFAQQGHRGVWTMEPTLPILVDDGLYRFVTEFQIGTHLALHREVISPEFQPTEVRLRFREPADLASYRQICDCVRFGQDSNQFMFDAKWLSRRPEAANLITYASARDLCSEMLAQMDQATGTAGAVRHWLLRMP
jgi:hypothetical protein